MSLADPGQPYSCEQWQAVSSADSPLIIDPNQAGNFNSTPYYNLYHDSWFATPTFVLIDHTMTIRAKPWTLTNNTNSNSCDGTNNTGDVIDRNEFIGDIYIKPARSINFITLNFIATRTGVAFSEVGG